MRRSDRARARRSVRPALMVAALGVAFLPVTGAVAQPGPADPGHRLAEATADTAADTTDGLELADDRDLLDDTAPVTLSELEPRGIDRVCPPPVNRGFDLDVDITYPDLGAAHADALTCATTYELIGGFEDGTVRPGEPVTRAQTASVVAAWVAIATGFELDVPEKQPFDDVAGTHADAIAALTDVGILAGRVDGTFDPEAALTRGQFTRVVANAISYADVFATGGPLPAVLTDGAELFDDVAGSTFEDDILALAAAGITVGTSPGSFSPGVEVSRGQLATFLMRGADYLDRHQRWRPTARTARLAADLERWRDTEPPTDAPSEPTDGSDDGSTGSDQSAASSPTAALSLQVNAFNGTAAFTIDLSEMPTLRDPDARLVVRLGAVEDDGPVVLELADATSLTGGDVGIVQGTVFEADSAVRLADLVTDPERAVVELQADGLPGGSLRGTLRTLP